MKHRWMMLISIVMLFLPWTILPLRTFSWALEMPAAQIIISCYAGAMILGGVFTAVVYMKGRLRNTLMKICLVINGIYAVGGIAAFAQMMV